MNTLQNKYIVALIVLNALLILVLYGFRIQIYDAGTRPFVWTIISVAWLFLYEIVVILVTGKKKDTTPQQSINLFLGLKVGKILLSLFFVTIYAIAIKVDLKRFVLVFVALYLIYLLFDTVYLAQKEKKKIYTKRINEK